MVPPRTPTAGPTRSPADTLGKAAHEVKTAATSMGGYAQLILRQLEREGAVEPDRLRHAMEAIAQQSGQLARLMNALLDVARIDAGQFVLDRRPVDVVALVREVVDTLRGRAGQHALRLTVPEGPLMASVDAMRLEQALVALVDNALKFGPPGRAIAVVVEASGQDGFSVAVADGGPGVAPGRRGRLFERFYQAHGEGFQGGLGLGLYLTREIAHRHGGRIEAQFPPGKGSKFVLKLPRT